MTVDDYSSGLNVRRHQNKLGTAISDSGTGAPCRRQPTRGSGARRAGSFLVDLRRLPTSDHDRGPWKWRFRWWWLLAALPVVVCFPSKLPSETTLVAANWSAYPSSVRLGGRLVKRTLDRLRRCNQYRTRKTIGRNEVMHRTPMPSGYAG
jgi:hypothetical protein